MDGTLCGVWIDRGGKAWVSRSTPDGGRLEESVPFEPFAWLSANPYGAPVQTNR